MKITFVYPAFENLGIEYISSTLREAGYTTELVFDPQLFNDTVISNKMLSTVFNFSKKVIKDIINSKPDIVAFSVVSDEYPWACTIAKEVKRRQDVPIVFGGIHPTSVPEEVIENDFVDFVIVGEGEYAMLDLVRAIEKGNPVYGIDNVWSKKNGRVIKNDVRPLIQDLDSLPFPDKELFYKKIEFCRKTYVIVTTRGCPYHCSFCSYSYLRKLYHKYPYYRRRSVNNVIKELVERKKKYNFKSVSFEDDIFTYDEGWLKEFAMEYKREINLPFSCDVTPSTFNHEILNSLRIAGCAEAEIGVQTININIKKKIHNDHDSLNQIEKTIDLLGREGIRTWADIILGLPGQTVKDLIDLVKFFNEHRVDDILIFWLKYYPKIEIVNLLTNKQREKLTLSERLDCFVAGGDTFNKDFSKIQILFNLFSILPKKLVNFIIDKRLYICFPSFLSKCSTYLNMVVFQRFKRKKRIFGRAMLSRRYFYFGVKKFLGG